MIDYIQGIPAEITPTYAVIDCNGLGYEVNITLIDYPAISPGGKVKSSFMSLYAKTLMYCTGLSTEEVASCSDSLSV